MRDDARLSANTAAEYGGGVYATGASTGEGASVECVGRASIAANSASYGGGAYVTTNAALRATNVSANAAGGDGGGAYLIDSATLEMAPGGAISGNTAFGGGGGAVFLGFKAELTLRDATADANSAYLSGGVLAIASQNAVVHAFAGATCRGNSALRGGVAYVCGAAALATRGSTFDGNGAMYGGCFYVDANAIFESHDDAHSGSRASLGSGGVLYAALYSEIALANNSYIGNSAVGNAGALYVEFASSLAVRDSTFRANTADGHGGAVYVVDTSGGSLRGCTLDANWAGGAAAAAGVSDGGAIYVKGESGHLIVNTTMRANAASRDGGAVFATSAGLALVGGALERNAAGGDGGGLAGTGLTAAYALSLVGTNVSANRAAARGGGAFFAEAEVDARAVALEGNVAAQGGGGLYVESGSDLVLHNCSLAYNTAAGASNGGGIALEGGSVASVARSRLARNFATGKGGAVSLRDDAMWNRHAANASNVFEANEALQYGGALYLWASAYYSCAAGDVFHDNIAQLAGGGLFWNYDGSGMNATDVADYDKRAARRGNAHGAGGWGGDIATFATTIVAAQDCAGGDCSEQSGIKFNSAVSVEAFDLYDQRTSLDATVTIDCVDDEYCAMPCVDCPGGCPASGVCATRASGFGDLSEDMVDGFVELKDFGYSLKPSVTLRLTATLQTDATPEGSSLSLKDDFDVLLGECTLGQETVTDDSGRSLCNDCDNDGLFYSQDPTATAPCQACPLSDKGDLAAKCTGAKIELLNGFWRHKPYKGVESTLIRACKNPDWCKSAKRYNKTALLESGDTDGNIFHHYDGNAIVRRALTWPSRCDPEKIDSDCSPPLCRDGHEGVLCGDCRVGWTYDDYIARCKECDAGKSSEGKIIIIGVLVGMLVLALVLAKFKNRILDFLNRNFVFLAALRHNFVQYRVKCKIVVTFLQIVSQYCGGTINPPWPDLYTKVGQKFEVINLNFVSLAAATCGIKPDYSWKLWGMVCTPVLGMIGIGAFYAVSLARLKIAHEFEAREHDEARRRRQEARRGNRESPSESPSSGEGAPATAEDATDAAEPASYCVDTGLVQPASAPSTTPTTKKTAEVSRDLARMNTASIEASVDNMEKRSEQIDAQRADPTLNPDMGGSVYAQKKSALKDLCVGAFFTLTYLVFPGVSLTVFRTLKCDHNISSEESGLGYLKADMGISCMSAKYTTMKYVAWVGIFLYPFGIPVMYFLLTYWHRHLINPSPMAVMIDILSVDETKHHIVIDDGMRLLANNALFLRTIQKVLRDHAKQLHADALQDEAERGASDKKVAATWEKHCVGHAATVADLEGASFLVETSMVVAYRAADKRVKFLGFLFEAYEPRCWYFESLECVRRLALTGMLIFFADGTVLQIIIASLISMSAMILYGVNAPFLDDAADKLATFAQLMTFLTLFAAILMTMEAVQNAVPDVVLSAIMITLNVAVLIYDNLSNGASDLDDPTDFFECCCSPEQLAETDVMVDEQVDRMLDDVTDTLKVPDKDRAAVLKELVKHFQH